MNNDRYHTDPAKWSCPKVLKSRFLVCKHIYEPITERVNFFHNVARSRTSPFWVHWFYGLNFDKLTVLSDGDGSEVSDDSEDDDSSIDSAAADEDRLADPDEDADESR